MLDVDTARRLLGDERISDEELRWLLSKIYALNVQVLDEYFADALSDDDVC